MQAILIVAVLIFSVVVHEVAHAWQARREGDDTAERLGRITLNPISHLDLVGSFIVPFVLYQLNIGFLFGWAKPVPVNPSKYRSLFGWDCIQSGVSRARDSWGSSSPQGDKLNRVTSKQSRGDLKSDGLLWDPNKSGACLL